MRILWSVNFYCISVETIGGHLPYLQSAIIFFEADYKEPLR